MVINESSLHSRSRNYHSNGRHFPAQRTTIEPASGRSSYYPHESTYYNTGSRGGGGGSSVTYVLPPSSGHKRYGSTTQLPSPLGYACVSRRNSANFGGQNLVVPRAGGSRFPSPVVGEFSHELSQRSPGIPPPCPEPPAQVDRGQLATHLPSNYNGRAHGARRSYHYSGQEQAFVEVAGAKRPSTLPIGMNASGHHYSPSPILHRAKSYSENPLTFAPEPSPRSFTFPSLPTVSYDSPVVVEPAPSYPSQSYYPGTTTSKPSYAPPPPPPPPPSDSYISVHFYPEHTDYSASSTDTYIGSPAFSAEDHYATPLDCPADSFSGKTEYDRPGRYDKQYSVEYSIPTIRTPQEEVTTPFGSDSDTYCEPNSETGVDFVEKESNKYQVPTAPVDTSYKPTSPPPLCTTTTGTTGRYATAGKPKPAEITVELEAEPANSSRRKYHSRMAAPGVKASNFDTSTLTPEEMGDECDRLEDLDDNFSPSPDSLGSYIPLSNLPTPPMENAKPYVSGDLNEEELVNLLGGGLTERQLIGGARLLAEKCPKSPLFKEGANRLKIQNILIPARLSMIVLVMAASILEHLDSEFVKDIAAECDTMQPQGVLCPNMIVVAALAIAYKYQADKSYTTEFWKNELNHVNQSFAPKGAIARPITRRMCATYERLLLIELDHRLLRIENDTESMNRIRRELEKYAQDVESTPNGFATAIGLGRYTQTHTGRR